MNILIDTFKVDLDRLIDNSITIISTERSDLINRIIEIVFDYDERYIIPKIKGDQSMDEEKGVYDILYKCPACGNQENMTVETWYAWDAPICECGQEMGEVSRVKEF